MPLLRDTSVAAVLLAALSVSAPSQAVPRRAPARAPVAAAAVELFNPPPGALERVARESGVIRAPRTATARRASGAVARGGGPTRGTRVEASLLGAASARAKRRDEVDCTRVAERGERAVRRHGAAPVVWERSARARERRRWNESVYCGDVSPRVVVTDQEIQTHGYSSDGAPGATFTTGPMYGGVPLP
jgi:hypothetical protein